LILRYSALVCKLPSTCAFAVTLAWNLQNSLKQFGYKAKNLRVPLNLELHCL
jgi:hypothetical protein